MSRKKSVYIAGPMTGVPEYWRPFERAEDDLTALGYIPLSPAHHPEGLTNAQYMRMCFAMIDVADAVVFLPNWMNSQGARLEHYYCQYIGKPVAYVTTEMSEQFDMLKHDLKEVIGT